jgi:hypothetical protein
VSDEGLAYLAEIPSLSVLDLSGTQITDDGLRHLTGLELRSLRISNPQLTDDSVKHLEAMKSIRRLSVRGTKISDQAKEHLKKVIPNLDVE